MEGCGLGDVFGTAIGAAKTAGCNLPNRTAIEAAIVDVIVLLDRFGAAIRANTPFVQPISVSV